MRVAIVHPWFPQYRRQFFAELIQAAERVGISVHVYHGDPPPEWGARGDAVEEEFAGRLGTKVFRVPGGRHFIAKDLSTLRAAGPYDLIVAEHAVRNIETYHLLFKSTPLAFWGHGKTYTQPTGHLQERFKSRLTMAASWFFSYTESGAKAVTDSGFPSSRITVLQNSVDTERLKTAMNGVSSRDVEEIRTHWDLTGKVAVFVGGLDASKRLPFLLRAGQRAHELDREFRLLVVGDGAERALIEASAHGSPWLRYVGPLPGEEKARALKVANVISMPGRVGLIAVDSMVAGLPIVTTDWRWHAPEFDYLENGRNAVILPDESDRYAYGLVELLNNTDRLNGLSVQCLKDASRYSIAEMVRRFVGGLEGAARAGLRRPVTSFLANARR